jgi:hypothetical protein
MKSPFDPDDARAKYEQAFSVTPGELELGTTAGQKSFRVPASHFDYHAHILGPTSQGKTRFLMQLFKELVRKTDSAVVFVDPLGNAYDMMVDWCYKQHLDDRLVLIDPGETRLVCGLNPIRPWETNHHLQASISWDGIRRALGSLDAASAPLLEFWMCNTLYALISTGLTMHEAQAMLQFHEPELREAIITRMPDTPERRDWDFLHEISEKRSIGAFKLWLEQVRSALLRVSAYSGQNEYLRRMLGTRERVVNWADVLEDRKIVLANLSGERYPNPVMSPEHTRMLGIQLINSLIQECFRRREAGPVYPVPCYLLVDECHNFVSAEMEKILSAGRQFKLRLILSHQYLHQLVDHKTLDPSVKYAVISQTLAKVVFGGLGPEEADEIGRTLFGHLLDPMRVKDEIKQWQQLSHVESVETVTRSHGSHESSASSTATGEGEVYADGGVLDMNDQIINKMRSGQLVYASQSGSSWNEAITQGLMVVPGEPFETITNRTFMDLAEQLHEHVSRMVRKPQQEAVFAFRKEPPVDFRVADVPNPDVDLEHLEGFKLDVISALPYYSEPRLIEEEIKDRHAELVRGLLPPRTQRPRKPTAD